MAGWLEAGWWGLVAGAALVVGAAAAWLVDVPTRVVAWIMSFGAGVLISALALNLIDEAERTGGMIATALGFLGGAIAYVAANSALACYGAQHRKRSHDRQPTEVAGQGQRGGDRYRCPAGRGS